MITRILTILKKALIAVGCTDRHLISSNFSNATYPQMQPARCFVVSLISSA